MLCPAFIKYFLQKQLFSEVNAAKSIRSSWEAGSLLFFFYCSINLKDFWQENWVKWACTALTCTKSLQFLLTSSNSHLLDCHWSDGKWRVDTSYVRLDFKCCSFTVVYMKKVYEKWWDSEKLWGYFPFGTCMSQ